MTKIWQDVRRSSVANMMPRLDAPHGRAIGQFPTVPPHSHADIIAENLQVHYGCEMELPTCSCISRDYPDSSDGESESSSEDKQEEEQEDEPEVKQKASATYADDPLECECQDCQLVEGAQVDLFTDSDGSGEGKVLHCCCDGQPWMDETIPHGLVLVLVRRVTVGTALLNKVPGFPATADAVQPGKKSGLLLLGHGDVFMRSEGSATPTRKSTSTMFGGASPKRKSNTFDFGGALPNKAKKAKTTQDTTKQPKVSADLYVPEAFLQVTKSQACIFMYSVPFNPI